MLKTSKKRKKIRPTPRALVRMDDGHDHAWYVLLTTQTRSLHRCAACGAERWIESEAQ